MTHAPTRDWLDGSALGAAPFVLLVGLGLLVGPLFGPRPATAQTTNEVDRSSLIKRYQEARYRALARRHLRREGQFPVYPPRQLPIPTDTLRPSRSPQRGATAREPSFPLHDLRPVRRLERSWFQERFADTEWSFLGETADYTFLDTTRTPDLRARLQTKFGAPTQTVVDRSLEKPLGNRTQFEYWFVVNDSIPVQVTDVSGPKERGLIVAVDRAHRGRLRALRDTLLAPLSRTNRAPYVDYYYDARRERWYRTGYDGQSFFLEQIPGTRVLPGRRAYLDTTRTSESAPPPDGDSP